MNRVRSVAAGLLLIGVIGLVPVALLRWGVPTTVLGDLAAARARQEQPREDDDA